MARRTRPNPLADLITPGAIFDTPFETGCVALAAPDDDGNFDARDSDGVECLFGVRMVTAVRPAADPQTEATRPLADWERELLAATTEPQDAPTGCTLSSIPGPACPNPLAGSDVKGGTLGCTFHLTAIEDNADPQPAAAPMDSAYCVQCHKDSLPLSLLCDREAVTDNGTDRDEDIVSRYEGRCLRCCTHNHG